MPTMDFVEYLDIDLTFFSHTQCNEDTSLQAQADVSR